MHAVGWGRMGVARWQASVLAAIYVDFTSGLREITLVGPAIGQSGGEKSRKRAQDTGQDEPCCCCCQYREGDREVGDCCPSDLSELCVQEFLVIILPASCKLTCII